MTGVMPMGLQSSLPVVTRGAGPEQLRETCRELESVFLENLLKQMRASTRSLSGEKPSFARETYEGWLDERFSRVMSGAGGIGLAEMMYRQLQQQQLTDA